MSRPTNDSELAPKAFGILFSDSLFPGAGAEGWTQDSYFYG